MQLQDLFQSSDTTSILICVLLNAFFYCRKDPLNVQVSQLEIVLGILEWIRVDDNTLWYL